MTHHKSAPHMHVVRYRGHKLSLHRLSMDELFRAMKIAQEHAEEAERYISAVDREIIRRTHNPLTAS